MSKHILSLDDELLLFKVVESIHKNNSRIVVGDFIDSPVASVWKGRVIKDIQVDPSEIVNLDYRTPHVEVKKITVSATTLKIPFSELETLEWAACPWKWIYPYSATIPHRKWLSNHKPGDVVTVVDDQFQYSELTLTEQHFKDHEYIIFRAAGQFIPKPMPEPLVVADEQTGVRWSVDTERHTFKA